MHPREGNIDQLVYFSNHKLSDAENNYTTNERECLAMVYALHKFQKHLLGPILYSSLSIMCSSIW